MSVRSSLVISGAVFSVIPTVQQFSPTSAKCKNNGNPVPIDNKKHHENRIQQKQIDKYVPSFNGTGLHRIDPFQSDTGDALVHSPPNHGWLFHQGAEDQL